MDRRAGGARGRVRARRRADRGDPAGPLRRLLEAAARRAAARRGRRGHPLGRADPARRSRARRRTAHDVPLLLVCLARPELLTPPTELARRPTPSASARCSERESERPARTTRSGRGARCRRARASARRRRGQPVLPRADGGHESRRPDRRQHSGDDPGRPRGAHRCADPVERAVLDCAAIEGRQFHRGVVAELLAAPDRGSLDASARIARPARPHPPRTPGLPGEEGYRFSHILIREAVYTLLPKARARRAARALRRARSRRAVGDRDLGEIIGYHFEQAYQCSTDLQPVQGLRPSPSGPRRRPPSGRRRPRALGRGDVPAAVNLLQRAAEAVR